MFDLPLSTTLLVFGFPLFWVLYTIGFLVLTRGWERGEQGRAERPDREASS